MQTVHQQLEDVNKKFAKINTDREESLDILSSNTLPSTSMSGMGDFSSAKLHKQQKKQKIKPEMSKIGPTTLKKPNPKPLESNQTKHPRTNIKTAKSSIPDNMQELSLITSDNAYYTCLGNYDPKKEEPVSKNSKSNLEIPSFRVTPYVSSDSIEGTEDMSDIIFEKRHYKFEQKEKKQKKWDLQQIRELERVNNLKEGQNRNRSKKSNDNNKEELTTLLPSPSNIQAIEITDELPVSAFGCNLYTKKKDETFKFYHSKWCNDGSQIPKME